MSFPFISFHFVSFCIHFPQCSFHVAFSSFHFAFISFHFPLLCHKHAGLRKVICSDRIRPNALLVRCYRFCCNFAIVLEACAGCHLQGSWTCTCTYMYELAIVFFTFIVGFWASNTALVVLRGKPNQNKRPRIMILSHLAYSKNYQWVCIILICIRYTFNILWPCFGFVPHVQVAGWKEKCRLQDFRRGCNSLSLDTRAGTTKQNETEQNWPCMAARFPRELCHVQGCAQCPAPWWASFGLGEQLSQVKVRRDVLHTLDLAILRSVCWNMLTSLESFEIVHRADSKWIEQMHTNAYKCMDLEISGDIQLIPASSCLVWPKPWQLGKSAETPRAMLCAPKPWASAGIDSCTMLICSSSVHHLFIICSSCDI